MDRVRKMRRAQLDRLSNPFAPLSRRRGRGVVAVAAMNQPRVLQAGDEDAQRRDRQQAERERVRPAGASRRRIASLPTPAAAAAPRPPHPNSPLTLIDTGALVVTPGA